MKWLEQEVEDLKLGVGIGLKVEEIADILSRTESSVLHKMSKLSIKSKVVRVAWNKKDNITYKSELPKDIEALEPYINDNTSILHQHTCGYKWAVKPTNILQGKGCPKCSKVL